MTPAYATPRVSEFREKASVAVTAKGWGAVGRRKGQLHGYKGSVWGHRKVLEPQ